MLRMIGFKRPKQTIADYIVVLKYKSDFRSQLREESTADTAHSTMQNLCKDLSSSLKVTSKIEASQVIFNFSMRSKDAEKFYNRVERLLKGVSFATPDIDAILLQKHIVFDESRQNLEKLDEENSSDEEVSDFDL